ncbi:MAG TPA: hypothetical protein VHZ74_13835 [Bryobacteraceae bacterium]|nr:hypothetical protein [Bryobacteraceae bacterium]
MQIVGAMLERDKAGRGDGRMQSSRRSNMAHKESESIINRAHIEESYANARNTGVSDRVSLEVYDRFDAEIRNATLVASLFTAGR